MRTHSWSLIVRVLLTVSLIEAASGAEPVEVGTQIYAKSRDVEIRVASDAKFEVASSKIEDVKQETLSQELERERNVNKGDQRVSQSRRIDGVGQSDVVYDNLISYSHVEGQRARKA